MRALRTFVLAIALVAASMGGAQAERLITSVSSSRVLITSSYTGAELVLFGSIERDGAISRSGTYELVVVVRGPAGLFTVREKQRFGPFWVNAEQAKYAEMPGYLALLSSKPLGEVTSGPLRERFQLSLEHMVAARGGYGPGRRREPEFHAALIRLRKEQQLFQENDKGVVFLAPNLFRAQIRLPATAPLGNYEAVTQLFADGAPLATEKSDFEVVKTGFEARVAQAAFGNPVQYGFFTVLLALGFGWLAHYAFRRD
ncbi:MAG: TIGR02186 family protein [Beijerinckiaceae bacterium]